MIKKNIFVYCPADKIYSSTSMGILSKLFGSGKHAQETAINEGIADHYAGLSNEAINGLINWNDFGGLTDQAKAIIRQELLRRNLPTVELDRLEEALAIPDPGERVFDKNACPVEEKRRLWIEQSFQTLLHFFGKENTLKRKVLIGEKYHFPVQFDGSEKAALATLQLIAKQMEVDPGQISLDYYDEALQQITEGTPMGMYLGMGALGKYEISLARTVLDNPESMIATLAHEIAHIKLLGEDKIMVNDEPLTDLTTVLFGLGVFNANEAFQISNDNRKYGWSQSGYLSQMEWGYALALFAYIRKEEQPIWAEYLCINVKADFYQGLDYIYRNEHKVLLSGVC